MSWNSLSQDHECKYCVGQVKKTIEDAQIIAKSKEGKCLSISMKDRFEKLLWECKKEHQWYASFSSVYNAWCPICGRERTNEAARKKSPSIEIIKETLNKIKMEIDSSEELNYINSTTPIKIICKEHKHSYYSNWDYIRQIKGCRYCTHQVKRTIEECKTKAIEKEGECLSNIYLGEKIKLKWKCKYNHIWEAGPGNILRDKCWCPTCSKGMGERICREFFEQIFNKPFPNVRPNWLIGPGKGLMQLDGYNEELCLAFEHDGEQHHRTTTIYTKTPEALEKRKLIDKTKDEICKQKGIKLIRVPEIPSKLKVENLKEYIKQQCLTLDIKLPIAFDNIIINLTSVNDYNHETFYLKKYKEIAEQKNWEITSDYYNGYYGKLEMVCDKGHKIKMAPSALLAEVKCPECNPIKQRTLESVKKLTEDMGLRLL